VPDYSSEFFEDDDDDEGDELVQVPATNVQAPAK
jgi:hypothetical protein